MGLYKVKHHSFSTTTKNKLNLKKKKRQKTYFDLVHAAVVEGEVGPDGLDVGGVVGAPAPVVDRG